MRFLANENISLSTVEALRSAGHDVSWAFENSPGASDVKILEQAAREQRLLLTQDKDFGELAFRHRMPAQFGILLFRLTSPTPEATTQRILSVIQSRSDWSGQFAVIETTRIRMRTLTPP